MVTVKFYGHLKRFEPADTGITLCVENFRELMSGLLSQIQGLRQQLRQGYYKVRIGRDRYLSETQIKSNAVLTLDKDCTIHFTPVVVGAGKNVAGMMNIVVGVVLIAASLQVGGAAGWAYLASGVAMAAAGAVQLLSKPPDMNTKVGDSEKKQSTSFSNIHNLTPQGRPIPLLYGKMMTSLILISQGVEAYDDLETSEKQATEKPSKVQTGSTPTPHSSSNTRPQREGKSMEREEKERAKSERQARERNSRMARDIF